MLRRFLIARTLTNLAFAMVQVAPSYAMPDIFHSASDLGLVLGDETITLVAGLLGAAIIADRVPRARLLLLADLMTGITLIALGLFGLFGLHNN